jgi:hypothetical protein
VAPAWRRGYDQPASQFIFRSRIVVLGQRWQAKNRRAPSVPTCLVVLLQLGQLAGAGAGVGVTRAGAQEKITAVSGFLVVAVVAQRVLSSPALEREDNPRLALSHGFIGDPPSYFGRSRTTQRSAICVQ